MNKTIPAPAAYLLNFIGDIEAPRGYDTIFGNNQDKLPRPITQMTLKEILNSQAGWSKRFGSSATGRYQFMRDTLLGLAKQFDLKAEQVFDADFQDWLGYKLLLRRGYAAWIAGTKSDAAFALELAKEWASLPVLGAVKGAHRELTRGQSYYTGDPLNKSLVSPERVENALRAAKGMKGTAIPVEPKKEEAPMTTGSFNPIDIISGLVRGGLARAAADPTNTLEPADVPKVADEVLDRITSDPRAREVIAPAPKPWTKSLTVWGVVLSSVLKITSVFVPWVDPAWADTFVQYAPLVASFGGDIMALVGRARAKRPLT